MLIIKNQENDTCTLFTQPNILQFLDPIFILHEASFKLQNITVLKIADLNRRKDCKDHTHLYHIKLACISMSEQTIYRKTHLMIYWHSHCYLYILKGYLIICNITNVYLIKDESINRQIEDKRPCFIENSFLKD